MGFAVFSRNYFRGFINERCNSYWGKRMRKVILMILLAIVSNSAVAEWVKGISKNDVTSYVDLPNISNGDSNQIWFLADFGKPQNIFGSSFMSIITKSEYNCKKEQIRNLSRTYHSGNMGKGEVVHDEPQGNWQQDKEKIMWKIACSAPKDWVEVGDNDNGTSYVNPSSLRQNGNGVKMWILLDYKTAQNFPSGLVMSSKLQEEFDCKEEQTRTIFGYFYSQNMAKGEVLYTKTTIGNWMPVALGSAGSELWKFACKK